MLPEDYSFIEHIYKYIRYIFIDITTKDLKWILLFFAGLLDGWLGRTDILIEDVLPVKVCTDTDDIPDEKLETQSVSSVEIKTGERQLLAQTIVFSFIQHKYNRQKMKNCLVPGIGIDSKNLLVYFYDSENDLLLGSTYLETFLNDYLAVENVVFLWLTLNYRHFCSGPDELMKKYPSGFVKLAGEHIEKYRNEVKIPAHRQYSQVVKETPWYKKLAFPMKKAIESHIELVQPKY